MNILHLLFSFNNGGSENLVVDILNSWQNTQDHLCLCIVNEFYDEKLLERIKNPLVEIVKLGRKPGSSKFEGRDKMCKLVRDRKIDVVHCHSIHVFYYALMMLGIKKNRKYILTIHNETVYKTLSKPEILLHRLFLHRITAISGAVKDSICTMGYPAQKIDIVYNGIDFQKYSELKADVRRDKKRVLCVGRMNPPEKGQDILIHAMKEVLTKDSKIECWFAGGNPETHDYLGDMMTLADELGTSQSVCFLGDCHDVPVQLANADLVVVPSREEGFGLAMVEAMAAKVPVIATRTGGPSEIIEDGVNGFLVECENPHQMAEKILQVLGMESSEITKRAYDYAFHNFNIQNTVRGMRKTYE